MTPAGAAFTSSSDRAIVDPIPRQHVKKIRTRARSISMANSGFRIIDFRVAVVVGEGKGENDLNKFV
jgi:hypothetical protein